MDYAAAYWFLVETGHLNGLPYSSSDVFLFQPKGKPLFSHLVLFLHRADADRVATMIDQKESRQGMNMRLVPHRITVADEFTNLLERLKKRGVLHVTVNDGSSEQTISIDNAILRFHVGGDL